MWAVVVHVHVVAVATDCLSPTLTCMQPCSWQQRGGTLRAYLLSHSAYSDSDWLGARLLTVNG